MVPLIPSRDQSSALELLADPVSQPPTRDGGWLSGIFRVLRLHPWLILGTTIAFCIAAAGLTFIAVPVYEASTTVRIDDKRSAVPALVEMLGADPDLSTEVEELQSRSLAAEVARSLALQFRLSRPAGVSRDDLFTAVQVDTAAEPAAYELRLVRERRYAVFDQDSGKQAAQVELGQRVQLPGVAFTLDPHAGAYSKIEFQVVTYGAAAGKLSTALTVRQVSRDAKIVEVSYRDSDPELAWKVARSVVEDFIGRREEVRTAQARSTAVFLRKQLDTLTSQLANSEDALKAYREQHRVVSPSTEASGQVERLVQTQSQRGLIEAERAALSQLLTTIEARSSVQRDDEQSPYTKVLSFPTLLQNRTVAELLQSLQVVQDQRRALLVRRTPQDPDVVALTERKAELEHQIQSVATTYLAGLSNQVTSLDSNLAKLNRDLAKIPETELQVARLERRPRVLDEIAGMLQTRLKEAEIAAAASDPSIRVVDQAVRPEQPISPRPMWNMMIATVGGLLLGVGAAFTREHLDKSVRSRNEVVLATGLPVLGVIPRIRGPRGRASVIAQERRPSSQLGPPERGTAPKGRSVPGDHRPALSPPASASRRTHYTFLGLTSPEKPAEEGPAFSSPAVAAKPNGARVAQVRWELSDKCRAAAEAYSCLQTNVTFARPETAVKVVVFTSAVPGEGKTTTTVNLALALTQRGLRTLIIDADIRRGKVHTLFGQSRGPGLTDVLAGALPFELALRGVQLGDANVLHYLPVGRPTDSPTGLLDSDAMRHLLHSVRDNYDMIIVDTSPINIVTDAALLSLLADGVLIVARAGVTDTAALEHALEQLRRVRAPVLGVVLNDVDFATYGSYDRAYRYYTDHNQYLSTEA
jgi:tyrosine-protein kinase Etk/Wzc